MTKHRVIAHNTVFGLHHIIKPDQIYRPHKKERPCCRWPDNGPGGEHTEYDKERNNEEFSHERLILYEAAIKFDKIKSII